jgi:sigma-B regulation protein RsbU (phosphoserine phosphatase)
MDKCLRIKSELRKQIKEILHIQIEVFHYDKIIILGISDEGHCESLLQTDSEQYDKFPFKSINSIKLNDFAIKSDLKLQSTLYKMCKFFDIQALFSINMNNACLAYMGIGSKIPTFTHRQIDVAHLMANYIGNLLHNDNLLEDLQYFSKRMEQLLDEMGTLHEITHAFESVRKLDSLLEYIMEKSQSVMQTEAASMMLIIEGTNELEFKVALGPKGKEVKPFRLPIGKGISGWVAKTGEPVLIPDCYSDPRFDPSFDKRSGFRTRSMLCLPMIYHDKIMGVMSVLNRKDGNPFNENDQMLFTIFASQAALAIENTRLLQSAIEKERLDKELQVAAEIQHLLIPQQIPDSEFIELAAEYIPCKEVGGDFYDILRLDDNRFVFVVADVSGKGIPGAMVVSNMQATLRAYLEYSADLIPVVSKLNEATIRQTTSDRYITFFIGLYDNRTSSFTYINAGHNPPFIIDKKGDIRELRKGGVFIGYVPWEYESDTLKMNPGDTLIMYTDGLVEAMNNKEEEFEFYRLKHLVKENLSKSPQELRKIIFDKVRDHIGDHPMEDDFTLLIMRRSSNSKHG